MGCNVVVTEHIFNRLAKYCSRHLIPFVTFLELTAACNASCPFCLRPSTDRRLRSQFLSLQEVKNVLNQVWSLGCFFVELTGGEPLMHPHFRDIVDYARKLGFAVAITTNGFLLDDDLINHLSQIGIYNLIISLHSVRDETYSRMFGVKRSVKPILNAISNIIAKDIPVQVAFTATKLNIDEFTETRKFVKELGVGMVSLNLVHERTDGSIPKSLMPTDEQIKAVYLQNPEYLEMRTRKPSQALTCVAGRSLLSIDFMGDVHPCTLFELPVGNIRKQSLKEIWETSPILQQIRSLKDEDFVQCIRCPAAKYCEVCIARNHSYAKDLCHLSPVNCRESRLVLQISDLLINQ